MKNLQTKTILVLMAACLFSCTSPNPKDPQTLFSELDKDAAPNTLAQNEKDKGWQLLFNGTTSEGWHGYNMKCRNVTPIFHTFPPTTPLCPSGGRGAREPLVYRNGVDSPSS